MRSTVTVTVTVYALEVLFSSQVSFQRHAHETLAVIYLQRGPPTADNKSTTHRTHTMIVDAY
jgi:hypothetical protein